MGGATMGPKIWAGILIGVLFLNVPLAQAQTQSELKEIEISGGYFKTYRVDGIKVKNIKELEEYLDQVYDSEMDESLMRGKNCFNYAQGCAIIGGALVGYPLGQALTGKEMNKPLLFSGIGLTAVGFFLVMNAEGHICLAVERYNAVVYEKRRVGFKADPFNRTLCLSFAW
jgi:hypothetical protein